MGGGTRGTRGTRGTKTVPLPAPGLIPPDKYVNRLPFESVCPKEWLVPSTPVSRPRGVWLSRAHRSSTASP